MKLDFRPFLNRRGSFAFVTRMASRKTEEEWKKILSAEEFEILRESGTERPFTNKYCNETKSGEYRCTGCNSVLFTSKDKFISSCGWPAFTQPATKEIILKQDNSCGMDRIEVKCGNCDGHLGHVFDDGPAPLGTRYCINSTSMKFENNK